jgi:hypothetical protein
MTSSLRLEVVPAPADVSGFQLLVHVDEVEVTSLGAGLGMSPFKVLIPVNRLVATHEPQVVPIARCDCGEYGCGMTDVRIVRDGDVVRWDWLEQVPLDHGVSFPAAQYDAEVARIGADRSWERPEDTIARLVLEQTDRAVLADAGLRLSWSGRDHRDPAWFVVSLLTEPVSHQVFLRFRREGTPEEVAAEAIRTLRRPPPTWQRATYNPVTRGTDGPPPMAGPDWQREDLGW